MADPMFSLGYAGIDEVGRALSLFCPETGHPVKKPERKGRTRGMIAGRVALRIQELWGPDGGTAKALGQEGGSVWSPSGQWEYDEPPAGLTDRMYGQQVGKKG